MRYIFIGGVGRSGTTVTNHFMRLHQDVCAFPMELKFIVEVDGLSDLVDALSTSFSITHRNVTLARFKQFMEQIVRFDPATIDTMKAASYGPPRHRLPDLFPNYDEALDAFLNTVTRGYYFTDRRCLVAHTRAFVESLFGNLAETQGKKIVCEKTPTNLMRLGFLYEIFPEAGFIHCIRDPRAVFYSLMKKGWMPDTEIGAKSVAAVFHRFEATRSQWDLAHHRYIEVRMEDLVTNTTKTLHRITTLLDIPPHEKMALDKAEAHMDRFWGADRKSVDLTPRFQEWRTKLDASDCALATKILEPHIAALGYPL